MKRLIAAAALAVFIILAFFTGYSYISSTCEQTEKLVDSCISEYKSDGDGSAEAERLEKFWLEKEDTLSIFVNHSILDEIEGAIGTLRVYSDCDRKEHFYEHSSAVKTLLRQLMEDTKPGMHSIL